MSMSGSGAESGWSRLRRAPSGPSDRALHRFVGWYAAGRLRLWIAVLSGAVVLADAAVIVAMIVVHPLVVPAALIPAGALYLVIQAPATAALMALVRRGGRNAGAAIGRQLRLEQELTVEAARRADRRQQDRRLHGTVLPIAVLVNAMSQVRVTVTGTAEPDLPSSPAWLAADSQRDQQSLWVEARWNTM